MDHPQMQLPYPTSSPHFFSVQSPLLNDSMGLKRKFSMETSEGAAKSFIPIELSQVMSLPVQNIDDTC